MTLKCQRLNVLTKKTPIKEGREREHSLEISILIGTNCKSQCSYSRPSSVCDAFQDLWGIKVAKSGVSESVFCICKVQMNYIKLRLLLVI